MSRAVCVVALASGCGFSLDPGRAAIDASPTDAVDASVIDGIDGAAAFDIAHLGPAEEQTINATADITWSSPVVINTQLLTTSIALPAGAQLRALPQPGGPDIALLEVGRLVITAPVTVTGTRPLIIYAVTEIQLTSSIDASAVLTLSGPGARTGGAGAGLAGTHAGTFADGGGGGGSFGTAGNVGGSATEGSAIGAAGAAGVSYGDPMLTVLEGGSAGGPGLPAACSAMALGGGGGGAIQLSAAGSIVFGTAASIDVGGGGGTGGPTCTGNMASAGGGGSGGAIYLQTPTLSGPGLLAANGGAGGSGSNWGGSVGAMRLGQAGQDGGIGGNAATGGPAQPGDGGRGGDGAAASGPQAGANVASTYPNGGGGGGGHGRIVLDVPATATIQIQSSPPYTRTP